MMKEAMFYKNINDDIVQCYLCPHSCVINPGMRGKCGVRENQAGKLIALSYGKTISTAVDPIEKKPLFHFLPGTKTYSISAVGCNMTCEFCQNWEISQMPKPMKPVFGKEMSPEEIVEDALESGCKSISYTYTEPTIFFEYAYDIAKIAYEKGLANVFVSNGFISKEAIDKISPYLDAINIDLKGFTEEFYENVCGARLEPVLDAIKRFHEKCVWIELTTLIVPGHNDSSEMIDNMADFIYKLDKRIPWHISRFHPQYKMQGQKPTDIETIKEAYDAGIKKGLKYVYTGNIYEGASEDTECPRCGKTIMRRDMFDLVETNLNKTKCGFCNEDIDLIIDVNTKDSLRTK